MLYLKTNHKICKIIEFTQEPFLKSYIEYNTDFQKEAEKENNKIKNQLVN